MIISALRPRIWVTPATLPALQAKATPTNDRWSTYKAICDRPGADWSNAGLIGYSLCYLVTGDPQYAQKAFSLMSQSMQSGLGQVTPDSGYNCRSYFPAACTLLDWCWPALTSGQQQQLIADIAACAQWVWPATNPSRAGAWSITNPGDNYWWGFLTTWLAGLALSGVHPAAQSLIDNALTQWNTVALPYLNGTAAGGVLLEGTSYSVDSLGLMLECLMAHSTATDQDLLRPQLISGWCHDAITALLHQTVPTMDALIPDGDQTKSSSGALQDPARLPLLIAFDRAANLDAGAWLQTTTPNRAQQRPNAWYEFCFGPNFAPLPTESG